MSYIGSDEKYLMCIVNTPEDMIFIYNKCCLICLKIKRKTKVLKFFESNKDEAALFQKLYNIKVIQVKCECESENRKVYLKNKELEKKEKQRSIKEKIEKLRQMKSHLSLGGGEKRIAKQHEFEEKLKKLCEPWIAQEVPMSTLCARAIKFLPEMFTFIRFEGVTSDNNSAERSVRHTVISRKISGGTRSARGSETKSILGSLFGTWKLQNLNPLEQCQLLLAQA